MSGLNYFLRRMDSDVLDRKFINALNKCSERYNSIKENYPQNLTWFKNFVTATLIMSLERMTKLEDEVEANKIQDSLMDYYADEIEERWNELQEFGIRESITRILREETEGYKVNLVKKIIYTLYDNISFVKESTYDGRPLLIIYFDSDDTAANIESWFDEKISRDIRELTSGNIVVCPDWIFDWDERKKNADVFINTELIKYDNLGNVVNESVLREESNKKNIRFKNTVKKYIDDYGISYAKKIFSMTTTDIIKILELPINSELAYEILLENMSNGNLTTKYKEFTIYPQKWDGTVYWGARIKTGYFLPNMSEEITAIATPFWDGNEWTPIDIDDVNLKDEYESVIIRRGGEDDYYRKLEHKSNFENVQELFTWYEEFYLPEVYNVVMNTLLPIVYQDIDDKLDERMSY